MASRGLNLASKRWLFIGPPGVGKGTYASRMATQYGLPHVSSGDLLRAEVRSGTPLGKQIGTLIDKGELVPNDLIASMITQHLAKLHKANVTSGKRNIGYILDGFPRTLEQAQAVDAGVKTGSNNLLIEYVVNFRQPYDVILEKLSSRRSCARCGMVYNYAKIDVAGIKMDPLVPKVEGKCDQCGSTEPLIIRNDDKREVVEHRLEQYRHQMEPLEKYYESQGKLIHFDVLGGAKEYLPKLVCTLEALD